MSSGQQWFRDLSVGAGTRNSSSILDVLSTTKGSRPIPSMTTAQRNAISSPASALLIFNTDLGRLEQYNGISWGPVNQGYGVYSYNYVDDASARFETNIGSWFGFDDGSAYVDGTGGTATNLTLSQTTNSSLVLEGDGSLSLAKAAADARYEGISLDLLTINRQDYGASLYCQISINASDANYASGDLKVYAYDITNGVILPVVNDNNGEIPSGTGKVLFQILPSTSTANIRLSLMVNSTNATAWTVYIDDIRVVTAAQIEAPIVGPWRSDLVFSGSWVSNTTYTSRCRRVGDSYECEVTISLSGSPTATPLTINLPFTIDTAKINSVNTNYALGTASLNDATSLAYPGFVRYSSSTSVQPVSIDAQGTAQVTKFTAINATVPFTWTTGDTLVMKFTVPVLGFNASAILSSTEASNQTAKVQAERTNTVSLADNVYTKLPFNSASVIKDTNLMYDSANDRFVVRQPGYFFIRGRIGIVPDATARNGGGAIYIDGALVEQTVLSRPASPSNTFNFPIVCGPVYLNAGQYIELYGFQNDISGSTSVNASNYSLGIFSLPDFSVFGVYGVNQALTSTSGLVNFPITVGNAGDLASLTLTPGVWDLYAQADYFSNGATTTTSISLGVSTVSGNTLPTTGSDGVLGTKNTTSGTHDSLFCHLPNQTVSATTIYYLKARAVNSITNLQVGWRFTAIRRA